MSKLPGFFFIFILGPTAVMEAYGGTMSKLPGFLFVYFFQVLRR